MYDWIDEFELDSGRDISKSIESPTVLARLYELAEQNTKDQELLRGDSWTDLTVVAGQGFNLAGQTTCGAYSCLKSEIDDLISKAWHYFDKVVVAGPSAGRTKLDIEQTPKRARARLYFNIANDVQILRYIRDIGALDRVSFRPDNWGHCYDCTRKQAVSMGLKVAVDNKVRRELIDQLEREAKISQKFELGQWTVRISHPFIEEPPCYAKQKRQTRREVASHIFERHGEASVRDYVKARTLRLPLATQAQSAWLRQPGQSNSSTIEERMGRVALHLEMPAIVGMPTKDLLAALADHRPNFVRFQAALRAAIADAVQKLDSKSDKEIAAAVLRDFVEPELQKIRVSLTEVNRNFSKKLAAGIALGTVTTSVGLIAAMPLVIGTGIAAGATVLPQLYKLFDDKTPVKTSDMYFLWALRKKAHN
jgi:hypothetical protein